MNRLKIIKTLVFIMTIALLAGSLFLVQNVAKRANRQPPAEINLQEPDISEIKQIASEDNKLYILTDDNSIIVFDTKSGKKISKIKLR